MLNVFLFLPGDSTHLSGQYFVGVSEMLPTGLVCHYYPRVPVTALTGSDAFAILPLWHMSCQRVICGAQKSKKYVPDNLSHLQTLKQPS